MRKKLKVSTPNGLHARSARIIVDLVEQYDARVFLKNNDVKADACSILELMMLAAAPGTVLDAEAEGPEARQVLSELDKLFKEGFREDE
ncbi:MAG: HPr family phosphocarrier protein [bacterium]